jgi:hypothetical protein
LAQPRDIAKELTYRISSDTAAFPEGLPERYALAWHGYLAGLMEWGIIDLSLYSKLIGLLPKINSPDPIETIFLGRDDD